jgi:hypothetical protein
MKESFSYVPVASFLISDENMIKTTLDEEYFRKQQDLMKNLEER